MGSKRALKLRFCWCKFDFRKIWTFSFPKPSRECVFDLWIEFYDFGKIPDFAKNRIFGHFLAILRSHVEISKWSKNRSRRRRTFLRTVLESWDRILSISNKIFEIWAFLQPERYTWIFLPKTRYGLEYTVLVPKRHQKLKFCWCKYYFQKIWTLRFPKPFRSSIYLV